MTGHCGITTVSIPACDLCGEKGDILYRSLKDRLFGVQGEWGFRQCTSCHYVWLDPRPIEAEIDKAYTNYYTHSSQTVRRTEKPQFGLPMQRVLHLAHSLFMHGTLLGKRKEQLGAMYLDPVAPGRLIEVGCGNGRFLARMRQLGWSVQGIEVDSRAARSAEKTLQVPVHVGSLESAAYPESSADAIAMNHVIEHVHDPLSILRECQRVLRPGGYLVVVTPNIESLGHRRFSADWFGLDAPRHLHLFSKETLSSCAEKAGFRAAKTWTTPARAEVLYSGSRDLQLDGFHDMEAPQPVKRTIQALVFQFLELVAMSWNRKLGEEVVLRVEN